jgi:uncharacterized protein YeaO (DUF488 family)
MIETARVYGLGEKGDAVFVLVDRLWPRGVRKEDLPIDWWAKEVAPGNELRKWYGHAPELWEEFKQRYFAELDTHPDAWKPILDAARKGRVVLLFSSKEPRINNATALKEYLEGKL